MPKKTVRKKHVPQRTCVGCREVLPKKRLIRLVNTPSGIIIDPSGKMSGRGAYLHERRSCWERGIKGALAHALKTELTQEDRQLLLEFMVDLPEEAQDYEEHNHD
ncbi:MAG: YlxR family protein [Anaerolineae bacterium]|nr:YlxR family protein [Anaerolineae bacterium]